MPRVLIIEDNRNYRTIFSENLLQYFPTLDIEEAENIEEAWRKIGEVPPQLVFLDIHLKGENSFGLMRQIKRDFPTVHIACLTGYDSPEYQEAARQNGADNFFVKEFLKWAEVEALIRSLLTE